MNRRPDSIIFASYAMQCTADCVTLTSSVLIVEQLPERETFLLRPRVTAMTWLDTSAAPVPSLAAIRLQSAASVISEIATPPQGGREGHVCVIARRRNAKLNAAEAERGEGVETSGRAFQ